MNNTRTTGKCMKLHPLVSNLVFNPTVKSFELDQIEILTLKAQIEQKIG